MTTTKTEEPYIRTFEHYVAVRPDEDYISILLPWRTPFDQIVPWAMSKAGTVIERSSPCPGHEIKGQYMNVFFGSQDGGASITHQILTMFAPHKDVERLIAIARQRIENVPAVFQTEPKPAGLVLCHTVSSGPELRTAVMTVSTVTKERTEVILWLERHRINAQLSTATQ